MRVPKIMEKDMREVMEQSISRRQAYMRMGISLQSYKKYVKLYNLQELDEKLKNPGLPGVSKGKGVCGLRGKHSQAGVSRKYSLPKILNGIIHSPFSPEIYKNVLLKKSILLEKCAMCGCQERRVLDNRIPLLLDYIDGNIKNGSMDNIRLLCYNCYFFNVGDLILNMRGFYKNKKILLTEDLDEGWIDWDSVVNEDEIDLTKL